MLPEGLVCPSYAAVDTLVGSAGWASLPSPFSAPQSPCAQTHVPISAHPNPLQASPVLILLACIWSGVHQRN